MYGKIAEAIILLPPTHRPTTHPNFPPFPANPFGWTDCRWNLRRNLRRHAVFTATWTLQLTFWGAPFKSPRSQNALVPVGSSSTSSVVLDGRRTCIWKESDLILEKSSLVVSKPHSVSIPGIGCCIVFLGPWGLWKLSFYTHYTWPTSINVVITNCAVCTDQKRPKNYFT